MKKFKSYIEVWGETEDGFHFRFRKEFIFKPNFFDFFRFLLMSYESRVIFIKYKFERSIYKVYPHLKWFDLSIISVDLAA